VSWIGLAFAAVLASYHVIRWRRTEPFLTPAPLDWAPSSEAPKVSFLVPAWNAAKDIREFVASYVALSYPNKELILCAGGSDGSFEVAKSFEAEDIKVIEQRPDQGKQRGLYESFPLSSGAIIYLTDIDCRPSDAAVYNLLRLLVCGEAQVATGASRPLDEQLKIPFVQVHWAVEQMAQPRELAQVRGILGRNAALSRSAVEASGAFSTPAVAGTDYTLAKEILKAGYPIYFAPGTPMPSEYPDRFGIYIRKQARWIRNVFVLGRSYGESAEVRATLVTIMLPLLLVGGLVLWGFHFRLVGVASLLLIFHAVMNRLHYLRYAGFSPQLLGSMKHFVADQVAALRAGWQILRGQMTW
jgi:cellulose synthase/poly-beta-1,6-N-acetylglucosamine synthase-like glycosyltransferase